MNEDSFPQVAGGCLSLSGINSHACRETCPAQQRVFTEHTGLKNKSLDLLCGEKMCTDKRQRKNVSTCFYREDTKLAIRE